MENATKALLIAGSILIVILLIAMGVRVFNSTSGTTDAVQSTMETTEVAMFNNKFRPYIGANKSKSNAMALANLIQAHNATNDRKIDVSFVIHTVTDGRLSSSASRNQSRDFLVEKCVQRTADAIASKKFNITATYDSQGYINKIHLVNGT